MCKFFPFMKETAKSMSQDEVRELIDLLVNNVNDPNNLLIPLENNKFKIINAADILYIHHPKKSTVTIILEKENVSYKNYAFDVMDYLANKNDNFKFLDALLLVNLSQIQNYHSFMRKVYFKNGSTVDITGASMNSVVIKHFGKCLDLYENKNQGEYAPNAKRVTN